jgi:beta-glucanase (GH16 family)
VPRGLGIWPAFWLAADQRPAELGDWSKMPMWPPEIDIMEVVNNGKEDTTRMLQTNAHVRDWANNPQQFNSISAIDGFNWMWRWWYAPFDFADDFHKFQLHYRAPICTWYCDDKFIFRIHYLWVNDDGKPSGPAHVLANLAIGGHSWAGRHGVDNDAFPQSFDLDYIRVWQKLPQSLIGHDFLPR